MKNRFYIPTLLLITLSGGLLCYGQCPSFSTPLYPSLSYNLDATPWKFELQVYGDTTGAQIAWYRYLYGTQTRANAVLYTGPGSNTVSACFPQTDAGVRNTHYAYFCVLKTPSCPAGIESADFDVQASLGSDCMTMDGTSFTIQSAPGEYKEGQTITLTAYYSGYGGFHYFTWYFNGSPLVEDENHVVFSDPDNFNYSVLTIPSSEVSDAGSYSVSVMDGPGCIKYTASPKAITVIPNEYLVFDDHNSTHVWSDVQNWWPHYDRIPVRIDSAVIRSRCHVDITDAQAGSLTIETTVDTALVIHSDAALTITRKLHGCQAGDLLIEADAAGNGALVMASGNNNIPATVQFYARSEQSSSALPVWQYVGYPMQGSPLLSEAYEGAEFYEWTNTPNIKNGGNWQKTDESTQKAEAFKGYCMTESERTVYTWNGVLNNPSTRTLAVPYNDQGAYSGFAMLANSWVAPIDIASMDISDFGAADATVYIMNTGTYQDALSQQSSVSEGIGMAAGQYNTIPVHAASYLPGALTVIPPMQGFFVHTNAATTLKLDYNKAVYAPALDKVSTTPARAPLRVDDERVPDLLRLRVSGFGYSDELYILLGEQFTDKFDNGWEGMKAYSRSPLSIAAVTEDGPMAVAALPQIEELPLWIEGGLDKYYTIRIQVLSDQVRSTDMFLYDKEEGSYTPLTDGAQYTFTFTGSAERFVIVRRKNSSTKGQSTKYEGTKFLRDGILYIEREGVVYDAFGHKINKSL